MNRFRKFVSYTTLSAVLSTGIVFAQDRSDRRDDHHDNGNNVDRQDDHHDNHQYVRHQEWHRGAPMRREDWDRGDRVDYRAYHLKRPPRGYEWRQVDGNYVMAAVATGIIATIIAGSLSR